MKSMLFSDVKNFIRYIQKKSYILQTITLILLICFIVRQEYTNNKILTDVKNVENKVDFRYYNLTRSLQDIFYIEIDTKDGRIRK